MKKFLVAVILAIVCFCSCNNNTDYCRSCEYEIIGINNDLASAYKMEDFCYEKLMSGELTPSEFDSYERSWRKYRNEIDDLEEKRKFYEMEIKKYSNNWEFSSWAKDTYNKVDSIRFAITPYLVRPISADK